VTEAEERVVAVQVNGVAYERRLPVRLLLSDFLRYDLALTGTHVGCEHGVCGACNVLVDGELVRSCLTLAVQVQGSSVVTIEGITPAVGLGPIQQALFDAHGLQCGFCTPGFVLAIHDLLDRDVPLDDATVREELSGNLCRCTGYVGIVKAVRRAAELRLEGTESAS
jgi:carbon-monoxide dehydrogenase small subunit